MIEYIPNHKVYSKTERVYCVLVCYEQKPPTGFKITFSLVHNPSLKLVTQKLKLAEAQRALSRNATWSLIGFLEAFPEEFWAESGMGVNFRMSSTQWNHQELQMPSPNL
jgi:hypothetical protein